MMTSILTTVIIFVLLAILLFFAGTRCVEESETVLLGQEPDISEKEASLFANDVFRKAIRYEFLVLIIGYAIMLFKETEGGQTVLRFIMEGKWDKGINLFSINASIIVAVITLVILFLIKSLFVFVGNTIGSRGKTISSIAISFLEFLGLFFIILHTSYQFAARSADTTSLTLRSFSRRF